MLWLVLFATMVPNVDFDMPNQNWLHLYDNLDRNSLLVNDDPNDVNDDGWHAALAVCWWWWANCNMMVVVVLMMLNNGGGGGIDSVVL